MPVRKNGSTPDLRTDIGWMVGTDGKPYVTIADGIPAGSYSADSMKLVGKQIETAAERAREMTAAWHWLVDGGIDREQANALLGKLHEAKNKDDLMKAVGTLSRMF